VRFVHHRHLWDVCFFFSFRRDGHLAIDVLAMFLERCVTTNARVFYTLCVSLLRLSGLGTRSRPKRKPGTTDSKSNCRFSKKEIRGHSLQSDDVPFIYNKEKILSLGQN
jgi:hypothetical protein